MKTELLRDPASIKKAVELWKAPLPEGLSIVGLYVSPKYPSGASCVLFEALGVVRVAVWDSPDVEVLPL